MHFGNRIQKHKMTIIVFLIDTSSSMNQRTYLGGRPTLLDVAKGAVETFVKVRQRCPDSRGDRYMLLTFEEPPVNIKAGWKENLATFMNELKNLQCYGMTTMGNALKNAFEILNINRMQSGIDTYGQGRCPYFLEPSVIVVITDGGRLSSNGGVHDEIYLQMQSPIPGSELTREPFRWDQRLFSLVLRLSGTPAVERDSGLVPSDTSPIDAMCEVTGGRSYAITSHRMLMQCIDSLVQKVISGVVIHFEKLGPDPPSLEPSLDLENKDPDWDGEPIKEWEKVRNGSDRPAWHSCRRLIYVARNGAQKGFAVGFWPIPESFWPDPCAISLPPRSAHPNVKFTCTSQEPMVIENLPFDKYELEPSPLTQYILARKQSTVCWQIFVANSYKSSEVVHPFGYLKASTNLTSVNMFVMPYNYPMLLPLLEELFKVHRCKPTNEWKTHFGNYTKTMPLYYGGPLRRALTRMGASTTLAQQLIPDNMENSLSHPVMTYIKRAKTQAKLEYDKLCNEVISKQTSKNNAPSESVRVVARSPFKKELLSNPLLQDKFLGLRDQLNDYNGFVVGLSKTQHRGSSSYRNPFDISRSMLLDQVVRMRANFLKPTLSHTKLVDEDSSHSMPVGQMGNYQEYLKRMTPLLREIESTPVRQHMFGNPFKIDKRMMVDEADIDLMGATSKSPKRPLTPSEPISPRPNKRKAGPIPREFRIRRPSTPSFQSLSYPNSPDHSPTYPNSPVHSPAYLTNPAISNSPAQSPALLRSPVQSPSHLPVYTPASPANVGGGFSNSTPTQTPIYPSCPLTATPSLSSTPTLTTLSPEPSHSPPATPAPGPWSMLGVTFNPPAGISTTFLNQEGGPSGVSYLNSNPEPSLQDTGGLTEFKMLNGDSKAPLDVRPRTPSPTMAYSLSNDIKSNLVMPAYSNHVPNLNEEKQISMILHEVNTNNHYSLTVNNDTGHKLMWGNPTPFNNGAMLVEEVPPKQERDLTEKDIRRHNLNVRALIYKEVRKPGRNFKHLFDHLDTIKGDLDIQVPLLKEIIKESLRFKRKSLASLLEEFLKTLQSNCLQKLTNNTLTKNPA